MRMLAMVLLLIGCSATMSQQPASPEPTLPPVGSVTAAPPLNPIYAELQQLESSKWDPARSHDREAFLALFAEDFASVEYGSDVQGGVHRRTRADVFSGPPAPTSRYALADWHFIQADEDVVVVSYRVNGLSFPWQAYATSVWTHRGDRWLTVFSQVSTAR